MGHARTAKSSLRTQDAENAPGVVPTPPETFILHEVFINSFCISQFPHKSVLFISVIIKKDKLTGL